ncbi:MAG: transporter substrate-binding domain-containing protein, partial [Bacilli bacterium]|nr:transporter substrate-binding domain-containing protein [Bacilli bacterium]
MKFIKTLPLLMVAGLSLVCCNKTNDVDAIKKAGFLNVGITIYEPMDYYDDDGETIIGFDAELSEAFAKSLDVSVRFIPIKWDSKILELTSNKIDVIWNGMTITDELKANIDLTIPYATNYQCVVTKTANIANYTNADSIKDKKVAVELGSAGEDAAVGVTNLNKVASQEAALIEVKAGTSDCAII